MKEKMSAILKNPKASKFIFIIGIAALILIFVSSWLPSDSQEESVSPEESFSDSEYCSSLEEDIKQIVLGISGDSSAIVTVTLETGKSYEYARELFEKGAEDENKTSEESEKTYITVKDSNGAETPLLITSYMPKIRGVSVICGASDEDIEQIRNAVCAALDITTRKIYIGRKAVQ